VRDARNDFAAPRARRQQHDVKKNQQRFELTAYSDTPEQLLRLHA
jgi:hypothetical protein